MVSFLTSEVAFFSTLIVSYVAFMGSDRVGPTPAEALKLPLVIGTTLCLLASSFTIHLAENALHHGNRRKFLIGWSVTIALGIVFLLGTAYEWYELLFNADPAKQLTISRNLFGSAFYTLVGFHGLHVTIGVIAMLIILGLVLRREVSAKNQAGVQLIAWYWHFVDVVWVVVFLVVYVAGRNGTP